MIELDTQLLTFFCHPTVKKLNLVINILDHFYFGCSLLNDDEGDDVTFF